MIIQSAAEMGRLIAKARKGRGLTQRQLADELNVSQPWISEIEAGKENARLGGVMRLMTYLGVRLSGELASGSGPHLTAREGERSDRISLDDLIDRHTRTPAPEKTQ